MLVFASASILGLNWYDWVVIVAAAYGVWSGIRRGFMGELMSVVGVVLMLYLSLKFYAPLGELLRAYLGFAIEPANLTAFVVISILVYLAAFSMSEYLHDKMKRGGVFAVSVENFGGAIGGLIRTLGIMTAITIALCLTRSEFWHSHVGRESKFGLYIVERYPPVAEMVNRNFKEKMWFMDDIKRREDPDLPNAQSDKN